jgi:hypothetical protein
LDGLTARVGGELAFSTSCLAFYLFGFIDSLTENLFQSLLFGSINRLRMLGVFQHFQRQAGILTIAFNSAKAIRCRAIVSPPSANWFMTRTSCFRNFFPVDGHYSSPIESIMPTAAY